MERHEIVSEIIRIEEALESRDLHPATREELLHQLVQKERALSDYDYGL